MRMAVLQDTEHDTIDYLDKVVGFEVNASLS